MARELCLQFGIKLKECHLTEEEARALRDRVDEWLAKGKRADGWIEVDQLPEAKLYV